MASDAAKRIGTAIMLRTMPGDEFRISADCFYQGAYTPGSTVSAADMVSSLTSALLGGETYTGVPVSEMQQNVAIISQAMNKPALPSQLNSMLSANTDPSAPRAYLNYLMFDQNLQLIPAQSGTVQVPTGGGSGIPWTTIRLSTLDGEVLRADAPGYIVIYINNNSIGKDVYFDDIKIEHYNGNVLEESHYYPFGLTVSQAASGAAAPENPYKYNTKELETTFGLQSYDYGARMYNSQIGRWNSIDPLADKYYGISPFAYVANNPVIFIDPDGRDLVFFNSSGGEIGRSQSNTQFRAFVQTGSISLPYLTTIPLFSEAPMPKIIQSKSGTPTTDPIYQQYDYNIAAETFIFNNNKDNGITPAHTNGKTIDDPSSVPDLDPTLVKATIMQESVMGTFDAKPNDRNDSKSDIMQANVYFSSNSNDWGEHKKQFGLTKDGGATPQQSIKAGIGLMFQKGLKTQNGKTSWVGGKAWEIASKNYNGGGAANYGNVLKMRDNAIDPSPSNYIKK